jgi:hypothetical protein
MHSHLAPSHHTYTSFGYCRVCSALYKTSSPVILQIQQRWPPDHPELNWAVLQNNTPVRPVWHVVKEGPRMKLYRPSPRQHPTRNCIQSEPMGSQQIQNPMNDVEWLYLMSGRSRYKCTDAPRHNTTLHPLTTAIYFQSLSFMINSRRGLMNHWVGFGFAPQSWMRRNQSTPLHILAKKTNGCENWGRLVVLCLSWGSMLHVLINFNIFRRSISGLIDKN